MWLALVVASTFGTPPPSYADVVREAVRHHHPEIARCQSGAPNAAAVKCVCAALCTLNLGKDFIDHQLVIRYPFSGADVGLWFTIERDGAAGTCGWDKVLPEPIDCRAKPPTK